MSDTSGFTEAYSQATEAFTKFVPGFEFLQGLVKNAGKAMPSMGQWVAPTLDPAELERRIEELKTVQFWLEQNARMLGATIQALEVQRMTLGTLKGMNVSLTDLGEALKVRVPEMFNAAAASSASAKTGAAPAPAPAPAAAPKADEAAGGVGAIDPMQWWGSLTEQFTQLAAQAIQATSDAARQASEATSDATQAMQAATAAAAEAAAEAAKPMAQAMNDVAQAAGQANQAGGATPSAKAAAAPARKAAKKASPAASPKAAKPAPARKASKPRAS